MESIPDLHDAAIVGITYDSSAKELALGLEVDGKRSSLLFGDTFGWILSPFEDQNVIFEVRVHEPTTTPAELLAKLPPQCAQAMERPGLKCIEISPSVGLGGYVVAGSLRYSGLPLKSMP